ncbi:MAG: 3-phosphoshikimate 1-carboxyvinyltransferase [Methanoregulaceae archaeon]|nr:3-phosphoshikimate 1-carboxyvinyltransferase [Methanoregulaceae archaeon]
MEVMIRKTRDVDLSFEAPPSKSYTHRALIAGSLAEGRSVVRHPLVSKDTLITRQALEQLGINIEDVPEGWAIDGSGGDLDCEKQCTIDAGNSGTTLRLLATVALLSRSAVTLTGSRRMQERPIAPLCDALRVLGAEIRYLGKVGFPPVTVDGRFHGGRVEVDARMSSQYVSSILLGAPYAGEEVTVSLPGPVSSRSYIDVTVDIMEKFGALVSRDGYRQFTVRNSRKYKGRTYSVEGDYTSASYFFAIAAICGGRVQVSNLDPDSAQGDRAFVGALETMGCQVSCGRDALTVESTGPLRGIEIDMSSSPDTVQTLCMVAACADGMSRISGISHLKYKESDRVRTTADLLNSLGGNVTVEEDALVIVPAPLHGGRIQTHDDHRIAMSFSVLGLGTGDIVIEDAECVEKSFPGYWKAFQGAGLCRG